MRQVRQRVSLLQTAFSRNRFVATSERNRLERKERNLLRVVECKPDNRPYLIVINPIDQCRNEYNLNSCFVKIVDCAQFHVEQVTDLTMTIRIVADPVKLEIDVAQARLGSLPAELFALREFNTVCRSLYRVVTDFS